MLCNTVKIISVLSLNCTKGKLMYNEEVLVQLNESREVLNRFLKKLVVEGGLYNQT